MTWSRPPARMVIVMARGTRALGDGLQENNTTPHFLTGSFLSMVVVI
jgi:hypothetical protein